MPLLGMVVGEPKISPVPYTFNILSKTRSLILASSSDQEKLEWIKTINKAISDVKTKSLSFGLKGATVSYLIEHE